MENQLVIEMASNHVAEHIHIGGISNEALRAACDIAVGYVSASTVDTVLVNAKRRSMDTVATCTKLSEMLHDETISESDLTSSITELAYNVFVGRAQDVAWEIR